MNSDSIVAVYRKLAPVVGHVDAVKLTKTYVAACARVDVAKVAAESALAVAKQTIR